MTATRIGLLEVSTDTIPEGLVLRLAGQADLKDNAELSACLLTAHSSALANGARKAVVDVREVQFMNSTALAAFVTWVAELQKVEMPRRYRILFRGDGKRRWQRGSLHAMASFAPEHVSVELE
jgi:anti-anti-sigma factor